MENVDGHDFPDPVYGNDIPKNAVSIQITLVEIHHQDAPGLLEDGFENERSGNIRGERFLAKNVASVLEGHARKFNVEMVRQQDNDTTSARIQKPFKIGKPVCLVTQPGARFAERFLIPGEDAGNLE